MKMPAVPALPLKGPYTLKDLPRFFRLMNVPIKPKGMLLPPYNAGRALVFMQLTHPDFATRYGQAIYRAHWSEGRNMSKPQALAELASELFGLPREEVLAGITKNKAVKQAYMDGVNKSIEFGVWGSPTFEVDGELFFGADRLWMVEEWLRKGGW